jgi:hypothetical protein
MKGNLLRIKTNNFHRVTFTRGLLVDSHSLHPHTHPYHHQAAPKKVVEAKGLRNKETETAYTHQSVSYLNAFLRCDPSIPGRPCCLLSDSARGNRQKLLRFLALSLFD